MTLSYTRPMTRPRRTAWIAIVTICFALTTGVVRAQEPGTDKSTILRLARNAYYSARKSGLETLNATVIPNWNVVLTATGTAPSSESLRLLTGLHFSMLVDATGETTVKHSADTPAPNPTVQGGYDQIFSGMDQMITGFY